MTKETTPKEDERKRILKIAEVNPGLQYELSKAPGAEKLMQCLQCGTCTADCPIARFSGSYSPRLIIRMAQLGLISKVLSSDTIWLCAACFTCTDRCPQDLELASVLRVLRNMAVKKGFIPEALREMGSNVVETGSVYKVPGSRIRKREAAGLPPLPKSNPRRLAKLAEIVGFPKLIEKRGM